MKKIIVLSIFILNLSVLASAQSKSTSKSPNTKHVSSTSHKAKKPVSKSRAQQKLKRTIEKNM